MNLGKSPAVERRDEDEANSSKDAEDDGADRGDGNLLMLQRAGDATDVTKPAFGENSKSPEDHGQDTSDDEEGLMRGLRLEEVV